MSCRVVALGTIICILCSSTLRSRILQYTLLSGKILVIYLAVARASVSLPSPNNLRFGPSSSAPDSLSISLDSQCISRKGLPAHHQPSRLATQYPSACFNRMQLAQRPEIDMNPSVKGGEHPPQSLIAPFGPAIWHDRMSLLTQDTYKS